MRYETHYYAVRYKLLIVRYKIIQNQVGQSVFHYMRRVKK